jgi:uncharacterized membrane protein YtjA (UPF0391 family)
VSVLHHRAPSLSHRSFDFEIHVDRHRSLRAHLFETAGFVLTKLKPARASRVDAPRSIGSRSTEKEKDMSNLLYWAVLFLIIAVIAAAFGFGGVAGTAMGGAQLLFWVAIVLLVLSLIGSLVGRGRH